MENWQIWLVSGLIFFILEMFTPALFFASLAVGCVFAALISFWGFNFTWQAMIFAFMTLGLVFLIRPLLLREKENSDSETGIKRYIGKTAKVVQKISNDQDSGRIKIFDEEWTARSNNNDDFEIGTIVEIKKIEQMILYVEEKGE